MKKVIMLFIILIYLLGCSTLNNFIKKDADSPLCINNQDIIVDDSLEKAAAEGKILEGMTTEMVKKSWGVPQNKVIKQSGFIIWEYDTSMLYFLEDVLIAWDEKK